MDLEGTSQDTQMVEDDVEEKKETNYLLIVLFYLLGTVSYMPQSIYVTANEYWMYKFRDPDQPFQSNSTQKTTLQRNFTAYAGFAINTGTVIFLFVTIGHLRKRVKNEHRIIGSMISMAVLFILTLSFVHVDTDSWQTGFFAISLILGGLLSSCSSVLLVSLYELSTQLSPRCVAAQFAGQALCGILAAATQVFTLLIGSSIETTALLYYAISAATIIVILILFAIVLNRSSEYQQITSGLGEKIEEAAKNRPKMSWAALGTILGKVKWLILSVVLCLGCTGVLHPGFTALIDSSGKGTSVWSGKFLGIVEWTALASLSIGLAPSTFRFANQSCAATWSAICCSLADTYFLPVCVFLLFHVLDFVGREISNYVEVLKNTYIIVGTSIIRLVLIPLIILCNIQSKDNTNTHVVFHDDAYFIIFMVLLALTNGYLVNVVLLLIYSDYCDPQARGISRLVMLILMIVCVPIFSLISSVLVNLI